jgi:hypothetical protein
MPDWPACHDTIVASDKKSGVADRRMTFPSFKSAVSSGGMLPEDMVGDGGGIFVLGIGEGTGAGFGLR